jgi:hypothetical protein
MKEKKTFNDQINELASTMTNGEKITSPAELSAYVARHKGHIMFFDDVENIARCYTCHESAQSN